MSYDAMVEQIKTVPQECLVDIENYIQFVLYRYNLNSRTEKNKNLSKYFGSVKFNKDALVLQQEIRNEWNGIDFLADTNALIYLLNGDSCMFPYL